MGNRLRQTCMTLLGRVAGVLMRPMGCALVVVLAGCQSAGSSSAAASQPALRPTVVPSTANAKTVDATPADLVGPTWYLQSWTTTSGLHVVPGTERPPTLVFDSLTAAHTDDPTNTTTWTLHLTSGALVGTEGPTTAVAEDLPTQAAYAAAQVVLASHARWQVDGDALVISGPGASSLSYTKDTVRALAFGTVDVGVYARGYQPYPISGTVSLTGPDGSVITRQVGVEGARVLRLVPGVYKVTAVVKAGTCTPTSVTVQGGGGARLAVACLLDNRQPPGQYTAILVRLIVTEVGGVSAGQENPGTGQVVVRNSHGAIAWRGKVTPWDRHPIFLTPGRYTVSAAIPEGRCAGGATKVVTHHISTLELACKHGPSIG